MPSSEGYLALGQEIWLKRLETPCAYNARTDDLYEISPEALEFLCLCDGSRTLGELAPEEEFLSFCLEEGVLEVCESPARREIRVGENALPSLRYLMVEVTGRCNLRCRHCYLGDAGSADLGWERLERAVEEFGGMGGLRFMVTGGEPLLYPRFAELNRLLAGRPYRRVLVTNGTLMGKVDYATLNFHEIQFSLDGLEGGHDFLRGPGNFARTTQAMRQALDAGIDVSVATVMHAYNLGELEELGSRLEEMGVMSWTLEYPVPEGRLRDSPGIMPDLAAAVPFMEMEWGSGMHEGVAGYACGAHLASILPAGRLVKCDYYADLTGGDVEGGLRRAWEALPRARVGGACAACEVLDECGGGCRYRALLLEGEEGPDPVMCLRQGRPPEA